MDLNNFILDNDSSEDENQIEQEISKIDIYIKQRNGRKSITIIEGLNQDKIHLKKIAKDLAKKMSVSGAVKKDDLGKFIIKFSGNNPKTIIEYLININYEKNNIHVHG